VNTALLEHSVGAESERRSPVAARRAVVRWGWRLFRREWRQQLLVLTLIVLAVAATVVGSTVATNNPPPANSGFGTAHDAARFGGNDPRLHAQIAALEHRFGKVDVIENETLSVPGSIATYQLRAQDPHGAFGGPMLSLVSGRYPNAAQEVAVTGGVASDFHLRIGSVWNVGGASRRVVGIVENPQSLLDEFALVVPGQVPAPSAVTVLFDAHGLPPSAIGPNVSTPASVAQNNGGFNPTTISISVLTIGMLLIALVAVGGFTVLAQRRLRSLGMLASVGATRRHVGLVVRANGLVVGVVGAAAGLVVGFLLWLGYRPHLESSAHHLIGVFALPWLVVVLAVVLAVLATFAAASRPARAIARVPVVAALAGRPAPPKQIHRSAVPGLVFLAIAFLLLGFAGSSQNGGGGGGGGQLELVIGLVLLIPGVILFAPFVLSLVGRVGRHAPVAVRLALRDLSRYRARSGSALAAISLGVMIAVIIAIVAAARYGNTLDYAGPNLASNQLALHANLPGPGKGPAGVAGAPSAAQEASLASAAKAIGAAIGAQHVVALETPNVNIQGTDGGRQFNGQLYVATPQLLAAFGISPAQVDPHADILSMRPGFSGISNLSLTWCSGTLTPATPGPGGGPVPGPNGATRIFAFNCSASSALRHPVIQELGALPSGTSAPNTVITEHAMKTLGLTSITTDWLIQTAQPVTATQIAEAQQAAASAGMDVESKNDAPTSAEVINWATVFGMALALAILAMSVGLIRSETAGDLRTLSATGASSRTRRTLTAATAGGLGFVAALLGTGAGYLGVIGYLRDNSLNGGISALGNIPVSNLLVILLGMPLLATAAGWVLAGRQPPAMAHQPIE
jgi:putative ABC transport system permease protein